MKQSVCSIVVAVIVAVSLSSCASSEGAFIDRSMTNEYTASIANAVLDGYVNVTGKIPAKRRVVVLGVTGADQSEAAWASDELIHLLVNAKRHKVIDRRGLDVELAEKKPSGEIEEASAQDIGYLLGAEMVVYGNISAYEDRIRFLSLKVMDVRSGDIIAVTSERFTSS
jgi:curli biogenesis system outer membrane secretion channel CsgG